MRFIILTQTQADRLRTATLDRVSRLVPRLVDLGPNAGKYVLPEEVLTDPAHREFTTTTLARLAPVEIDPATLWAPEETV